jgi:Holliday junction resolvase
MGNLESKFQNKIINLINTKYGICLKYNQDYKTKSGIPDLFAAVNNKAIFIEVKTEKGEPSDIQLAQMHKIKKKATNFVYLVSPKEYNYLVEELEKIKRGEI